jgi:hypothetical protein
LFQHLLPASPLSHFKICLNIKIWHNLPHPSKKANGVGSVLELQHSPCHGCMSL